MWPSSVAGIKCPKSWQYAKSKNGNSGHDCNQSILLQSIEKYDDYLFFLAPIVLVFIRIMPFYLIAWQRNSTLTFHQRVFDDELKFSSILLVSNLFVYNCSKSKFSLSNKRCLTKVNDILDFQKTLYFYFIWFEWGIWNRHKQYHFFYPNTITQYFQRGLNKTQYQYQYLD